MIKLQYTVPWKVALCIIFLLGICLYAAICINIRNRVYLLIMSKTDNIIKTEELVFSYIMPDDEKPSIVLGGINIELEKGKFVAIIGHNGSGKSTLAKHFNAILLPSGGRVFVKGLLTSDESMLLEIRRQVGVVFQNPDNQIVATIVEEDVAFGPENLGYPPEEIRRRVDQALKQVGMYEYRLHAPHLLSGGQKQMVAIAGVLAMGSECIVLDEPTAMLDPRGRESVIDTILDLRDRNGVSIVLITHHMDEVIKADRVIVMKDGQVSLDGTPREVFSDISALELARVSVPETILLMNKLNQEGFELPLDVLSVEECAQAIFEARQRLLNPRKEG